MLPPTYVLVLEDNPATRRLYRWTLEHAGHAVEDTDDPARAIEMARAHPPGVVVLDLRLVKGDALGFLHGFRGLPGCEAVPVLACSGSLERIEAASRQGLAFHDMLVKPVLPDRLLAAVASALARARSPGAGP